jgi:hypothetical protein
MNHLFLYTVFYFASVALPHFVVSLPCSRRVGLEMKETNKCLVSSTKNKMNNMKETAVRFGKLLLEQRHAL